MKLISCIDSHTAGEPTRVVIDGIPDLGSGPLSERKQIFRNRFDEFRSLVINEPRGSDILVGALLVEPFEPNCSAGVIFFNNVAPLNMCGHGTIGLMVTLAMTGKIKPGVHRIDTPVGVVTATLHDQHKASIQNVPSYRYQKNVRVKLADREVTGDIAWGGNWFFLCHDHGMDIAKENCTQLTQLSLSIRDAIIRQGITGENGGEIDHIELVSSAKSPENHGRNFVLCPGGAYDRSPCGTGTSAKLACLAADGKLKPGQIWRQESVLGTVFEGSYTTHNGSEKIIPTITGTAYITAELKLIVDPADDLKII